MLGEKTPSNGSNVGGSIRQNSSSNEREASERKSEVPDQNINDGAGNEDDGETGDGGSFKSDNSRASMFGSFSNLRSRFFRTSTGRMRSQAPGLDEDTPLATTSPLDAAIPQRRATQLGANDTNASRGSRKRSILPFRNVGISKVAPNTSSINGVGNGSGGPAFKAGAISEKHMDEMSQWIIGFKRTQQ